MCLRRENIQRRRQRVVLLCRWLPIAIILGFLAWSYHIFVVQVCIWKVDSIIYKVFLLLGYHLLLIMFLWTWFKSICTSAAPIPDHWYLSVEDVDRLERNNGVEGEARILINAARYLPINMCTNEGTVRYCRFCWIIKPDRAHHCRSCRICVLKMDHHCPWVNNCVHFHNLKYFIQFLFYSELYCLYIFAVLIYDFYLICQFKMENLGPKHMWALTQYMACFIFNMFNMIMLIISVANVAKNRTTMEATYSPYFFAFGETKNGFNIGCRNNFRQVFGDKWYLWLIPIQSTPGDGLTYPLKPATFQVQRGPNDPSTRERVVKTNVGRLLGLCTVNDFDYPSE